ncbi:hypothetical protein BD309DRAFT_369523 [Dichomitus squalens]|nr:hypothetical protein BD309DRAFT_369523 [Dichomitus squalens]
MRGCKQTCSIHAAAQKIDAAPKSGSRTNSPPSTAANNELLHTQRPPTLLTRSFNITRPAPPRLASLPPCKQTLHYQLPLPVSRHKILQLVWDDVSVNLVDGSWATEIGFALEFRFPAHGNSSEVVNTPLPERARNGKLDLRQNLFDALYVTPASPSCFLDGQPASDPSHARLRAARVFPALPASRVLLSSADSQACDDVPASTLQPPVQRLRGDSRTGGGQEDFEREVEWFKTTYDEDMSFWDEANSGKTRAGTR